MKHGFTLAEVLITLGVIGVVSAITMPVLVSKIKLKIFETAFKKEYSLLNNTINYLNIEENISRCYVARFYKVDGNAYYGAETSDCNLLQEYLIDKLKLSEVKNDFKLLYKDKEQVRSGGGYSTNWSVGYDSIVQNGKAYHSNNGTVILMDRRYNNGGGYSNASLIIDLNGEKAPNKWGYDVFYLSLTQTGGGSLRLSDEWGSIAEKGGVLPRTILQNKLQVEENDIKNANWN